MFLLYKDGLMNEHLLEFSPSTVFTCAQIQYCIYLYRIYIHTRTYYIYIHINNIIYALYLSHAQVNQVRKGCEIVKLRKIIIVFSAKG